MALCNECTEVAAENRKFFDTTPADELDYVLYAHPENCGCPCMHKDPQQWEKQFSVEQP